MCVGDGWDCVCGVFVGGEIAVAKGLAVARGREGEGDAVVTGVEFPSCGVILGPAMVGGVVTLGLRCWGLGRAAGCGGKLGGGQEW